MATTGLTGGAQAALTTSEAYVDLSALAGRTVKLWCADGDIWFSAAANGTTSGTLVTAGVQAASDTALVAERLAAGWKEPFFIKSTHTVLVVKMVTGTGTLKVKVVGDGVANYELAPEPATVTAGTTTISGTVTVEDQHTEGQAVPVALPAAALNSIPLAQYNTSAPTLTAAQVAALQSDVNGNLKVREQYGPVAEDETNGVIATRALPLAVATYATSHAFNAQVATNVIVKASAGVVYGKVQGYLDLALGAGTFYVLCLNEVSAVNGTRALLRGQRKIVIPAVPVDMPFELDFGEAGVYFGTGLTICVSSTGGNGAGTANVTLAAAQLVVESVRYK